MKKVSIDINEALKAHDEACDKKELMIKLFGEDVFPKEITERIKNFEDACKEVGVDHRLFVSCGIQALKFDTKSIEAYAKLIVIVRALNEGWQPNWNDGNERKYYPWFQYESGVCFAYGAYGYTTTISVVGSRLCFKSQDLADYAGKQFKSIYNDYFKM